MRKQTKIKFAFQFQSEIRKTMSALLLASRIIDYSKIAIIDIENHSTDPLELNLEKNYKQNH